MSDKEPRRRKKRKDSQKKDDIRSDDQIFMPTKPENRDSDQEPEEEFIVPVHQPSNFAKFVFIVLFSGLILSMSFIFLSLKGADRGSSDLDVNHGEEQIVLPGENEVLPDYHEEHEISHAEEEGSWSHDSLKAGLEDILPGISSILSLNNEQVEQTEDTVLSTPVTSESTDVNEALEISQVKIQQPEEHSIDQGVLQKYTEDEEPDLASTVDEEMVASQSFYATDSPFTSSPVQTEESESVSESFPFVEEFMSTFEPSSDDLQTSTDESVYDEIRYEPEFQDTDDIYEKADITNHADYEIKEQLDEVDKVLEKSPDKALKKCEELLPLYSQSPRLLFMKAQALDSLAEIHQSNKHLEEAVDIYQTVMSLKDVPQKLYLLAGERAANRLRFRGYLGKSVKLLSEMSEKFPQNIDLKNQVAVGYLLIGQNQHSKKLFLEILKFAPHSGFAKVHLGFILKTDESNYNEAIKLLKEGIASREDGVIDGRFYFHLGDALHRMGKNCEALKVYENAVKEGLFLSVYQRSLYNVAKLTGKPWWTPETTPYASYFKMLENRWLTIKNEVMSLMEGKNSGFLPEAEGLQDKGNWKQLELYARGRKIEKNCIKVPKTCALISQIPDAASCKRGQVKFSILHPDTHVWAHTGPTNCRLRAHLGLVIPEGPSIRVANETRKWEEGKIILFDDSFEHEVWHNGSSPRLVLIVDFWHPELTAYQKRTLTPI